MGPNKPTQHVIRLQKEKRKFRIRWSIGSRDPGWGWGGREEGQREIGRGGRIPGELCAC